MILFHDLETFSEVPINCGTYAYAEGAEIMIESWAIDDGPVHVTDRTAGELGPFDYFGVEDFEWIVYHGGNGPTFDRVVQAALGHVIPPEKIWDTAVQARSHGLPGGLDKLCAIFSMGDDLAKKDGKKLIQLFCKPRPQNIKLRRATSRSHPVEWGRFKEYAGADIPPMRHLFKVLPRWNYPTCEHGLWCLDQKINERGFKVDLALAEAAIQLVVDEKAITDAETKEMTEGRLRSTTQRDMLLKELLIEHGVSLPDLTGDTIERRLEDESLDPAVKELLRQRLLTSSTSTSKYKKILSGVSADGRMRGTLLFCGAPRTKRWCIAEGALVLTKLNGRIASTPIQNVTTQHLVWDGEEWVVHEGVVFSGDKNVIEHDGVVATPEHVVYLSTSKHTTLGKAKEASAALWPGNNTQYIA